MDHKKLNAQITANLLSMKMRKSLTKFVGSTNSKGIRASIADTLKQAQLKGLITTENGFEVGRVDILWKTWTLKQKLKWTFYNKTPVVKTLAAKLRKEIEDHNHLVWELREIESEIVPSKKDLPDYLICRPKSIIVSDIKIRPTQSMDFIVMNLEVNDNV